MATVRVRIVILTVRITLSVCPSVQSYGTYCQQEDGGWRMEDGGWRMEDGGWRMEDGGWRMEDGGRRMEDGGWRMEDGGSWLAHLIEGTLAGLNSRFYLDRHAC
jgi:hypothetical protein